MIIYSRLSNNLILTGSIESGKSLPKGKSVKIYKQISKQIISREKNDYDTVIRAHLNIAKSFDV